MKHPSAFYLGDQALLGPDPKSEVRICGFVRPASGRQLVAFTYPDGRRGRCGFAALEPLR